MRSCRRAFGCGGRWRSRARPQRDRGAPVFRQVAEPQPGLPLVHRPGLLRVPHAAGDPAQHPGEPGVVHGVHAVSGGDRPGPARGAAQLPDDGDRSHGSAGGQRVAARRGHGGRRGDGRRVEHARGTHERDIFFVSRDCHPQTIEVVRTRAKALGITVVVGDHRTFAFGPTVFGALVQYPASDGAILDFGPAALSTRRRTATGAARRTGRLGVTRGMRRAPILVVAADLSPDLLTPPGNWGPTSPWAARSASASRSATAARTPRSSPAARSSRARCRAAIIGVSRDADGQPGAAHGAADARAAHPPREGDEQHLHGAGAARRHGEHVRRVARAGGAPPDRASAIHRLAGGVRRGLRRLGYVRRRTTCSSIRSAWSWAGAS